MGKHLAAIAFLMMTAQVASAAVLCEIESPLANVGQALWIVDAGPKAKKVSVLSAEGNQTLKRFNVKYEGATTNTALWTGPSSELRVFADGKRMALLIKDPVMGQRYLEAKGCHIR